MPLRKIPKIQTQMTERGQNDLNDQNNLNNNRLFRKQKLIGMGENVGDLGNENFYNSKTLKKENDKTVLIRLLSEALSDEWKAALQYKIHASRMRGLYSGGIAEHLDEHANDEIEHAERLTKHFYARGIPIDINIPKFNPGNEPLEMIRLDLQGELDAIERYRKIVELCDGKPKYIDTQMLIEDILVDEVEHQDDDASFIKKTIDKSDPLSPKVKLAISSTLVKVANVADDLGLEELADRYTDIIKMIK